MKKNIAMILAAMFLLSSCNFAHSLGTTGAAGIGALVCGSVGGPVVGAACASAATVTVEVLAPVVSDKVTFETIGGADGLNSFSEFLTYGYVQFFNHLTGIAIFLFFMVALFWYFGKRSVRPEEKLQTEQIRMMLDMIAKMKK